MSQYNETADPYVGAAGDCPSADVHLMCTLDAGHDGDHVGDRVGGFGDGTHDGTWSDTQETPGPKLRDGWGVHKDSENCPCPACKKMMTEGEDYAHDAGIGWSCIPCATVKDEPGIKHLDQIPGAAATIKAFTSMAETIREAEFRITRSLNVPAHLLGGPASPSAPAKKTCRHFSTPEVIPGTEVAVHPGDHEQREVQPAGATLPMHGKVLLRPDHQQQARDHALRLGRTTVAMPPAREWPTCSETALPLEIEPRMRTPDEAYAVLTCTACGGAS